MKWTITILVFGLLSAAAGQAPAQSQLEQLQKELTATNSAAPMNPPGSTSAPPSHTDLAYYAWRLFVWSQQGTKASLTDGNGRGTASANFIETGKKALYGSPTILEGLYHRSEAFPYFTGSPPPSPIKQVPVYRFKQGTVSAGKGQYVNLDETNQIGQNYLYYRQSNGPDFPVLFMAKVNAAEVSYAQQAGRIAPGNKTSWDFPDGVLETKTAWRRISDIKNSDVSKYHQATATYYTEAANGTFTVTTDTFALIAVHIIQKSENYQTFLFSTFEHVDAVTRNSGGAIVDPAYQLTYANLEYQQGDPTSATALGAYSINAPGQSGQPNGTQTYTLPTAGGQPSGYVTVEQPKTITSEVNEANNTVGGKITALDPNSIWANYRLKGVQAVPSSDDATTLDYYLANIVVESSRPGIQLFRGGTGGQSANSTPDSSTVFYNTRTNVFLSGFPKGTTGFGPSTKPAPAFVSGNISMGLTYNQPVPKPKFTMGGCMGCHGVAQQFGGDFSFLAQAQGRGFDADTVPPPSMTTAQREAHKAAVALRRAAYLFRK